MKFISITGIDKSGKSTIIQEIYEKTNGLVYVMDRDISTWHFFNILMDRDRHNISYKKEYNAKLKDFRRVVDLSILLNIDEDTWKNRCEKHNEQELVGTLSMLEHQKELSRWFDKAKYKNVLKLNTSELTIDECVNKILKRI